ncbi:MAG: hypothetical protein FJ253_06145, partial [Phycisphaerae bacterium]|nr:hypothetical protein [Phycisphaerae bacterium]
MPSSRITLAATWSLLAAGAGCTDSFTVTAPYEQVWSTSTETLVANGFEMVVVPDAERMIPASSEWTGRAWFLATALPDPAGWEAPRVVQITIDPVSPRQTHSRRITVEVEKRDWVVR